MLDLLFAPSQNQLEAKKRYEADALLLERLNKEDDSSTLKRTHKTARRTESQRAAMQPTYDEQPHKLEPLLKRKDKKFAVLGEWQAEKGSVEFVLRRANMLKFGRQQFVCARNSPRKVGENLLQCTGLAHAGLPAAFGFSDDDPLFNEYAFDAKDEIIVMQTAYNCHLPPFELLRCRNCGILGHSRKCEQCLS